MTMLTTRLRRRSRRRPSRSHGENEAPGRATRGQALVEFAFGLPLMLLIMVGTLDIGQVFIDYVALRNACREGASYGARNPTDYTAIEDRIYEHSPLIDDGATDIDVEYSTTDFDPEVTDAATITIRGRRSFTPVMAGFLAMFSDDLATFELEAVATAEILK